MGSHSLLQGNQPDPGIEPRYPAIADRFFTIWATREAQDDTKKSNHDENNPWKNFVGILLKYFHLLRILQERPQNEHVIFTIASMRGQQWNGAFRWIVLAWSVASRKYKTAPHSLKCLSVQFSRSVVSNSLRPHGLQHTWLPHPSPPPGAYSNSYALRRWCHPTISSSCHFLLLPSSFPSIRVFSSESALRIR